jgi:hypothetical protein
MLINNWLEDLLSRLLSEIYYGCATVFLTLMKEHKSKLSGQKIGRIK